MNHQTRTAGLPARGKFRFGGASSDNRGEFRPGYSAGRALRGVFAGRDPAPAPEEAGVDPDGVEVLGTLPELFIPPTGFEVVPVLA